MEEQSATTRLDLSRRQIATIVAALTVGVFILSGVIYWTVVPDVADRLVREKLEALDRRAGLEADYREIETSATQGVEFHDFEITGPGAEKPLLKIGHARATLSLYHLVFGDPVISSLEVRDVQARLVRGADGRTNVERVLKEIRSGESTGPDREVSDGGDSSPDLLRRFGGVWPDAMVSNTTVQFESAESAAPWPVESLAIDSFEVDSSGETATIQGTVAVTPGAGGDPRWQLPEKVGLDGTLRLPLDTSTGELTFEDSLEVVGLAPVPYLRAGLSSLRVGEDATVELRGLSVAVQADGSPRPFGTADRLLVSLEEWPRSLTGIRLDEVIVEKPKVIAEVDRQHGSAINDLIQLARAPVARRVADRAHLVARSMYLDIPRWRRPELDDDGKKVAEKETDDGSEKSEDATGDDGDDSGDSGAEGAERTIADRIRKIVRSDIVSRLTPETIRVEEAEVALTDDRRLGLERPADALGLREGSLVFEHDSDSGDVKLEGGFNAYAGESSSRGAVDIGIGGNYRDGTVEGSARIESLDLSWFSQMTGASIARRIQGGTLDAEFKSRRNTSTDRHEFNGHFELDRARLSFAHLADDPVEQLTAGYTFEGHYAPEAAIPDPEHIEWRHLSPDERLDEKTARGVSPARNSADAGSAKREGPPEDATYPTEGAVVFTEGRATLNGAKAQFRPALYGLEGLRTLPARFDLAVQLEETPVQALFEAVPKAIRGPLADAALKGTFQWDFDVEVPLYNAGEMEWSTKPKLRDFQLKALPEEVDIRTLEGAFSHRITDPKIDFERRVDIPKMRPVSARHLVDCCEISLESLDKRRRRRGWPPLPRISELGPGTPSSIRGGPAVWTTDAAERAAAPRPWLDGQPLATIDERDIPPGTDPVEYAERKIREAEQSPTEPETNTHTTNRHERTRLGAQKKPNEPEDEPKSEESSFSFDPFGSIDDSNPSGQTDSGSWGSSAQKRPDPPPLDRSILVVKEGKRQIHPYGPYVYVPLHHMSRWLPRAVMTTEDNSFFDHDGFNWFALEESVEDNIGAGGFVRGGSTISMQLVKNLYLSFDKVLARKLREAFLVWIMEDVVDVPKARILELYFNIIEFGPGIFGIHDASVHYFGKRPDELTLSEVLFLISIVPNPKEYHRFYERGEISDSRFDSMISYAEIMQSRDRASAEDVERVRNHRPSFHKPKPGEPKLRPPSHDSPISDETSTEEKTSPERESGADDFSEIFQ